MSMVARVLFAFAAWAYRSLALWGRDRASTALTVVVAVCGWRLLVSKKSSWRGDRRRQLVGWGGSEVWVKERNLVTWMSICKIDMYFLSFS